VPIIRIASGIDNDPGYHALPLVRPPRELSWELLQDKCRDFTEFQVWPLRLKMNPEGWLSNFPSRERRFAYHLLNAFMYFSADLTDQLFLSAVQNISQSLRANVPLHSDLSTTWNAFLRDAHITYVTGEIPGPADSGYLFSRKARDLIPIDEDRILYPREALEFAVSGDPAPIIFVDDFVGSGNQFCDTWQREYNIGGAMESFEGLFAAGALPPTYYCPPICTQYGLETIRRLCPGVTVSAGNLLDHRYNVFHPESLAWPAELRMSGPAFIERKSVEIGIPADRGEWDYRGFHDLGLALAFSHKTPDATIPLFRWAEGGWQPLVVEG